jgi:hypothetical protein
VHHLKYGSLMAARVRFKVKRTVGAYTIDFKKIILTLLHAGDKYSFQK